MSFRVITFLFLLLGLPSSAFAFWAQPIFEGCEIEASVLDISIAPTPSPCSEEESEENNLCYEAAAFPISTTQSLIKLMAKWKHGSEKDFSTDTGEDVLRQFVEIARISWSSISNPNEHSKKSSRACSLTNISDCEFAPAIPTVDFPSFSAIAWVRIRTMPVFVENLDIESKTKSSKPDYLSFVEQWSTRPLVPPPQVG